MFSISLFPLLLIEDTLNFQQQKPGRLCVYMNDNLGLLYEWGSLPTYIWVWQKQWRVLLPSRTLLLTKLFTQTDTLPLVLLFFPYEYKQRSTEKQIAIFFKENCDWCFSVTVRLMLNDPNHSIIQSRKITKLSQANSVPSFSLSFFIQTCEYSWVNYDKNQYVQAYLTLLTYTVREMS